MIMLMNILRRLFLSLLAGLLSASLFGLAWSNITISTIHNRTTVKSWFDKSDFYNKIVDVVLENAKDSGENSNGLPINDPKLQAVAKQAFTPELLKNSVNSILDGSYNWLDGSKQNLDFKIDLTNAKQQLATGLGNYVTERAAALPACPGGTDISNFDGFNATCLPAGLSAQAAGDKARDDLLKQDFLKNPVITADSINLSKDKNAPATTSKVTEDKKAQITRTAYQRSSGLPIILAVVSVLLALAIVFISSEKFKGVRRVGYILIVNGVILLVIYLVLNKAFSVASTKIQSGHSNFKAASLGISFAKVVLNSVQHVMIWYILAYIILGVAAIVASKMMTKGSKPAHAAAPTDTPEPRHADLTPITEEEKSATHKEKEEDKKSEANEKPEEK